MNNERKWALGRRLVYAVVGYLLVSNALVVHAAIYRRMDTETLISILDNNTALLSIVLGVVFGGKAIKEHILRR